MPDVVRGGSGTSGQGLVEVRGAQGQVVGVWRRSGVNRGGSEASEWNLVRSE